MESENTTLSAPAILSVQIINYKDVNGIPELFGKKVTGLTFADGSPIDDEARKLRSRRPFR